MTVSPSYVENLTGAYVNVYGNAADAVIRAITAQIARGLDSDDWAHQKLMAIAEVQQRLRNLLVGANAKGVTAASNAYLRAMQQGSDSALSALRDAQIDPSDARVNIHALQSLARAQAFSDAPPYLAILRSSMDAYQSIVSRVTAGAIVGVDTRRQAAQNALWLATDNGLSNVVDARGRVWELETWAEMSVRTATARTMIDAHTNRLAANGQNLVIISDAPQECKICRPFEGKVLTIDGSLDVRASGSLDNARRAGLFHPNCRHTADLYIHGITQVPHQTADPQGDADRQKLRAMERQVRTWKKRQAAAFTPEAKALAGRKVRDWQGQIRRHTETSSVARQRSKEQIGRAR